MLGAVYSSAPLGGLLSTCRFLESTERGWLPPGQSGWLGFG